MSAPCACGLGDAPRGHLWSCPRATPMDDFARTALYGHPDAGPEVLPDLKPPASLRPPSAARTYDGDDRDA